jgi:hypothetical protein
VSPDPTFAPESIPTLKIGVRVRESSFEDYPRIAQLHVRNQLPIKPYEDWASLWSCNPVYKRIEGWRPVGWVLETDDGEIVGSVGNIPLGYCFQGRELRAAAPCSWVVDSPYRRYSMLLLDRFTRQEDVDLVVCTTVSANAEPAMKAFQWSRAPVGSWHKADFWITNYRGFVESALSTRSKAIARAVSYPLSVALFCRDLFKRGLRGSESTPEIELCMTFDSRFDEFWKELRRQNPNVLLAVRDVETLAWHFRDSLLRQGVRILAASKGARLVGYAVFDRQDSASYGLKRARLVDFQALDGSASVLSSALSWMLRESRAQGLHSLEIVGCWLQRPGLPQIAAPYRRTLPSSTYYYKAIDGDLCEALQDPAVWAPSSYDGDASL